LRDFRLRAYQIGLGLFQRIQRIARIDAGDDLAGLHPVAFVHAQVDDLPTDIGA
jgi:hypothetical protein